MKNRKALVLLFSVLFLSLLLVGCLPSPVTPTPANKLPIITSTPITVATVGFVYSYDVNATDPDGDTLTYTLSVAPSGMNIDYTTGIISWSPSSLQLGDNEVVVRVSDGSLSDTQSFTITVSEASGPGFYTSGTVVVHGTWICNLDLGQEGGNSSDFWWRQVNDVERYIVPQNGAQFHVIGVVDFNSIDYLNLKGYSYSSAEINGSNNASNQIPTGIVVACITSEERYCKFRIDNYGYNLTISWVTYNKN